MQKHDAGAALAQALTNLAQHKALGAQGEAFVDVEADDAEFVGGHRTARLMGSLLILSESAA
jgi:ribosomal protein S12 methylthiotransferase accessory factor YcaO